MNSLGYRLIATRVALNASRSLVNRCAFGVDNATNISRIEDGTVKSPRPATVEKLAEALGVSKHWLATGRLAETDTVAAVAGVGGRIERARRFAGLSARALARTSGLGESAENIRRLERGDSYPTRATVARIASVLRVKPSVLEYGA